MPSGTIWKGPMRVTFPLEHAIQADGTVGAGTSTLDCSKACYHTLTCSAATRTIAAPLNPRVGARIFVDVNNQSGGVLTITWNAVFKQAATAPASTKRRVFTFIYDGTNWVQDGVGLDL